MTKAMAVVVLVCGLVFGAGPGSATSIEARESIPLASVPLESQGVPSSQIQFLEGYKHSIDAPHDKMASSDQSSAPRAQDGINGGNHENLFLDSSANATRDPSSVAQYNKLPLDIVMLKGPQTSLESLVNESVATSAQNSNDGLVLQPGVVSPARDLSMPADQAPPVPVCKGEQCELGVSSDEDSDDLDADDDDEDAIVADELATSIADVLLWSLDKNVSVSISMKIDRPSPFLEKDARDPRNVDDETYRVLVHSAVDGSLDTDYEDDQKIEPEGLESKTAAVNPGQNGGVLIDGTQKDGLVIFTDQSPTKTSSDGEGSAALDDSTIRRIRSSNTRHFDQYHGGSPWDARYFYPNRYEELGHPHGYRRHHPRRTTGRRPRPYWTGQNYGVVGGYPVVLVKYETVHDTHLNSPYLQRPIVPSLNHHHVN